VWGVPRTQFQHVQPVHTALSIYKLQLIHRHWLAITTCNSIYEPSLSAVFIYRTPPLSACPSSPGPFGACFAPATYFSTKSRSAGLEKSNLQDVLERWKESEHVTAVYAT